MRNWLAQKLIIIAMWIAPRLDETIGTEYSTTYYQILKNPLTMGTEQAKLRVR